MENKKRLIDANALYESISGIGKNMKGPRAVELACLVMISEAPTVDAVEVKHGLWISYLDGEHIMPDVYFKCNRCGSRGHRLRWHYCPNCGAKMDGGVEHG